MAAIGRIDLEPSPKREPEPGSDVGARLAARADLACARILASVGLRPDGAPVRAAPVAPATPPEPVKRRAVAPRQKVAEPSAPPTSVLARPPKAKPVRGKAAPNAALAKEPKAATVTKPAPVAARIARKTRAGSKAV